MRSGCSSLSNVASTSFTLCAHFFQLNSSLSLTRSLAHFSASTPFTSTCPSSRFGTCEGGRGWWCQVAVSQGGLVWVTGVALSQVASDITRANQIPDRGIYASWQFLIEISDTLGERMKTKKNERRKNQKKTGAFQYTLRQKGGTKKVP